jgi:hypothetical protein
MRIPPNVRSVAEVIGMDAAVRLIGQSYPNRQIYVPAREHPGHRLSSVLAPHELTALQRTFGGELLTYPSARGIKRRIKAERKAQAIREDIGNGLATIEIAAKHGVSDSYVRRIRSRGTTSSGWRRPAKCDSQT